MMHLKDHSLLDLAHTHTHTHTHYVYICIYKYIYIYTHLDHMRLKCCSKSQMPMANTPQVASEKANCHYIDYSHHSAFFECFSHPFNQAYSEEMN